MNRKNLLMIKLVLLILLFVMLCTISVGAFRSWGFPFSGMREVGLANQTYSEGDAQTFSNVDKIVVDAISLPIHVYESDVKEVTIIDNSKSYGFGFGEKNTLAQEDGTVYFKQGKRIAFFSVTRGDIVIEVPTGTILEYDLNSISGSISHDAPSKNDLYVKSVSGSIRVAQGGDDVVAKSTSGSIRIYGGFITTDAKSTSGSVRVVATNQAKDVTCYSVSGSVKIQLEDVSGYRMSYSSVSGSVKDVYQGIDYARSGTTTSGDGSVNIDATSTSGSIKLTDWE